MPSFRFTGFEVGASVAVSAVQGANTGSASIPTWGQGSMNASLDILKVHAPSVPAPASVWFEAIDLAGFDFGGPGPGEIYDPSFDKITFVWTVTGGAALNYGVPALPTAWRDGKIAYGKRVSLFFPEPDVTYTIRCWAIDNNGNWGEATTTFTPQNADDIYPGAATICLDPSGSFTGAPAGAQNVTSVSAMQAAVNASAAPRRLLIARGQDIAGFTVNGTGGGLRYIGTFGSGARPILRTAGLTGSMFSFTGTSAPYLTISGCDCRGDWDAATETGYPSANPLATSVSSMLHLTVWDCRFDGFSLALIALRNTTAWTASFGNTEITNWQDYGMFIAPSPLAKIALVGCDIAQHPQALNDYAGNRVGLMNQQGPIRAPGYSAFYIGATSFLSRGGWSGGIDQSCLRLNSDCLEGVSTIVERAVIEGGANPVAMTGTDTSMVEKPGNYLFDKTLMIAGGGKTARFATAQFGGTTIRNSLFVATDAPNKAGFSFSECVILTPDQPDAGNYAAEVKLYSCTSLNLRSAASDQGDNPRLYNTPAFTTFTGESNAVHAPTLDTPVVADTLGLTSDIPGFTARYLGTRANFPFETGTLGSAVGNGGSFTLAYPAGTNQGYWQGLPGSDNKHGLHMGDVTYYAAYGGGFAVAFEAGQVRVTNLSGTTWPGGTQWTLRLDRKSQLPAVDTTYGNPPTLPLPVPAGGSALFTGGDLGLHAYDDFLGNVRPGPGGADHSGNARPATGNAMGAVLTGSP